MSDIYLVDSSDALVYPTTVLSSLSEDEISGLGVIELEYSVKLKIKRNDWLLADTCPQAANHCALFLF